jgi:UDP-N-acetylmuramate dehydrogenase
MEYSGKYSLKNHSTLKIGPLDAKVAYIDDKDDLILAVKLAEKEGLIPYPLGGGSNTIFSDSVVDKYLFLIPKMSSVKLFSVRPDLTENNLITIEAGLEWDKAVEQTVEMGLSGLEALSWIPGLVGASPVQNIGAYGAEVKDTIQVVHAYDMKEKKFVDFSNEECEFEYRNSIFKKNPGKYFIYAVTFALSKTPPLVPQYKDVISYFENKNISSPTLKEIREAIIEIRKSKLPNPAETPNAGSYFGNPIISKETTEALLQKFPDIPMFPFVIPAEAGIQFRTPLSSSLYSAGIQVNSENLKDTNSALGSPGVPEDDKRGYKKLFAGWLIDKVGLKGYEKGNFSIHPNHALVIIGNGKGNLDELLEFENYIKQKVFEMFGVELEREPVLVGSK